MKVTIYILNSLTKDDNGGNPAGVVLHSDNLSDLQMKQIAERMGFSETAFVMRSETADFRTRFFTPSGEIDLCGYATVASFYLMNQKQLIKAGEYVQETKSGNLKVEVAFEQGYSMGSPSEILTRLTISDGEIKRVQIGGTAEIIKEVEIDI